MSQEEVAAYWAQVRDRARRIRIRPDGAPVDPADEPTDPSDDQPPAWAFGATPEQADESLQLILDGVKTATCCPLRDYQLENQPLPEVGTLAIILDGSDQPRALIRTTDVQIVRFDKVSADHAYAEGEGDRSLEHWRAVHEWFFKEYDEHIRGFSKDMRLVLERFEVLAPDVSPPSGPNPEEPGVRR